MSILKESRSSHYRANAYRPDGCVVRRYLSDDGDLRELDRWIDEAVDSGKATGGDVEMYVPGFGWCVYND